MGKLLFLGGTCGESPWRGALTAHLIEAGVNADHIFNPVVADWNEEAQEREEKAKREASHFLFYLGSPYQDGIPVSAYSMVEATMALYDNHSRVVVIFDHTDITGHSLKSHKQAEKVLRARFPKANIFATLKEGEDWLIKQLR